MLLAAAASAECDGCLVEGKCLPVGMRVEGQYCFADGLMHEQKAMGAACENSFECKKGACNEGACVNVVQKGKGWWASIKEFVYRIFRIRVVKRI